MTVLLMGATCVPQAIPLTVPQAIPLTVPQAIPLTSYYNNTISDFVRMKSRSLDARNSHFVKSNVSSYQERTSPAQNT